MKPKDKPSATERRDDDPAITHPDSFIRVQVSATSSRIFRVPTEYERVWGRQPYSIEEEPDPDIRRVIEEEGARPSSLITVHKPRIPDPLHDMQLLRDLKIINELTVKELGPLPPGGLQVQAKRKPKSWSPNSHAPMPASAQSENEEDEMMKASHAVSAAVLAAATMLTACGSEGHAPNASDANNKSASAESAASPPNEQGSSNIAAASSPVKPMTYRGLVKALSLDCEDADKGRGCTMSSANTEDRFTVTLHPRCGKEGIFVVVSDRRVAEGRVDYGEEGDDAERGAELWAEGPPSKAEIRATLSKGQVVCIQATAYIEDEVIPSYYYVTTVPVEMLKNCSSAACEKYVDPPITWHVPHPGPACRATGPWSYEGICAAGWIRADYISGYFKQESSTNDTQKEPGK